MRKLTLPLVAAAALAAAINVSAARADITIAVAGPITGDLAEFGAQMKRGAEKAVADLNKAGGVMGQQIKLETGDDAFIRRRGEEACATLEGRSSARERYARG